MLRFWILSRSQLSLLISGLARFTVFVASIAVLETFRSSIGEPSIYS